MFSARKTKVVSVDPAPEPTAEILALIARMRALSVADEELAKLIDELEPHLPKARDEKTEAGNFQSFDR